MVREEAGWADSERGGARTFFWHRAGPQEEKSADGHRARRSALTTTFSLDLASGVPCTD